MNKYKHASPRLKSRLKRKARVRKSIVGTDQRPRLCVYRSLKGTYAQLISDESGKVLVSANSASVADGTSAKSVDAAKLLGKKMAELAKENNVEHIVFDRNGYLYHGRIAAVAEGAREAGLQF